MEIPKKGEGKGGGGGGERGDDEIEQPEAKWGVSTFSPSNPTQSNPVQTSPIQSNFSLVLRLAGSSLRPFIRQSSPVQSTRWTLLATPRPLFFLFLATAMGKK